MRATFPLRRDDIGGALLILTGLGVAVRARTYDVGSLTAMGPGFIPVTLGVLLALSGIVLVIATRLSAAPTTEDAARPQWMPWTLILVGIAAFVVLGRYGGLVPATFAIVFISALADRDNTPLRAAILALAMVAIAVVIFWWALQLQFPLFAWG